jgi:hypothetical protein
VKLQNFLSTLLVNELKIATTDVNSPDDMPNATVKQWNGLPLADFSPNAATAKGSPNVNPTARIFNGQSTIQMAELRCYAWE